VINSSHWFYYLSIDVKGCLGNHAKLVIQDRIALRISLAITLRLAKQALLADPDSYAPPSEVMRRAYGLTINAGVWTLYVVVAVAQGAQQGEGDVEQEARRERHRLGLDIASYVSRLVLFLPCWVAVLDCFHSAPSPLPLKHTFPTFALSPFLFSTPLGPITPCA